MIPQGFQKVATTTTYHHLPGSVKGLGRQDNGNPAACVEDIDPRENFVAWRAGGGLSQSIISPKDSPELSMLRRFKNGDGLSLEKETLTPSGDYLHIEVRHQKFEDASAHLTTQTAGGDFQDYRATGAVAENILSQMNHEFEAQWNVR